MTMSKCIIDPRPVDKDGYIQSPSHRQVYEAFMGPVSSDHVVHHMCTNKTCINPVHLVPLTKSQHGKLHNPKRLQLEAGYEPAYHAERILARTYYPVTTYKVLKS